jgi:uncharacterized membrane protein
MEALNMDKKVFILFGLILSVSGLIVLANSPLGLVGYCFLGMGLLMFSYRFSLTKPESSSIEDTRLTSKRGNYFSYSGLLVLFAGIIVQYVFQP